MSAVGICCGNKRAQDKLYFSSPQNELGLLIRDGVAAFFSFFFFRAFTCGMLPSNTRGWVLSSVRLWLVIFRSLSSTTWSSSWKLLINSTCRQAQGRLTDWVAVLFVKPEWGVGNPGVKFIKFYGAIELQFDRPLDKPRVPAESKQ